MHYTAHVVISVCGVGVSYFPFGLPSKSAYCKNSGFGINNTDFYDRLLASIFLVVTP